MARRVVSATEFKAKCLALLDEIERHRESLLITKRGRPVALLGPAPATAWQSPGNSWADKAEIVGDIVNSSASDWEVVTGG
jgi:prevent-host-death family protein